VERELLFPDAERAAGYARSSSDPPRSLVRVAVERSIDAAGAFKAGDEGLTYAGEGYTVGDRVEVPLGRGDTTAFGVVIAAGGPELLGTLDFTRVKSVRRAAGPRLPEHLVELARWVSRYYVTPLGMVFASIIPGAAKQSVGERTQQLIDRGAPPDELPRLTPSASRAWQRIKGLDQATFPIEPKALAQLVEAPNVGPVNRLVEAGLLELVERRSIRARGELFPSAAWADRRPPPPLTAEQRSVIDGVWTRRTAQPFAVHLLHGITGSGKTEVYLRLLERCLAAGRAGLVLVPEIGLTPQTAGRFIGRFPDERVAVLHSGLSDSVRHAAWDAAARGESRIVVGPRSAVFAPIDNLGLVIVDEEHDASYKQDSLPRYHGRDVAIKRAQLAGCPVVLGSATPALESYARAAANAPKYALWRLTERVGGGRMPPVRIVDMASERRADAERERTAEPPLIGPTLRRALSETIETGGQAILLLNRRGYAGHLACPDPICGWVMNCRHCEAKMVLHRAGQRPGQAAPRGFLRCHHCAAEQVRPNACPVCEKKTVVLGAGTQKAEEQLGSWLVDAMGLDAEQLVRVDADAMRAARLHATLARFGAGEIRILIGTQMLAKGLDYPNVRLVGVLSADTALAIPDFRAEERTFQLVAQVAGRAGRGEHPGRVIVQTMDPDQPAITLASKHDYDTFASRELRIRHDAGFPPATRMARIVCRDRSRDAASGACQTIAAELRDAAEPGVRIDGPWPCPIPRIADHFRFGVELFAPGPAPIQRVLGRLRSAKLIKSDAHTAIDVDPFTLI